MKNWLRTSICIGFCLSLVLAGCGEASPSPTASPAGTLSTPTFPSIAVATPQQTALALPSVSEGITQTIDATVVAARETWTRVADLAFADDQHGWMIVSEPNAVTTILATADGGRTWTEQRRGQGISAIDAVSSTHIWAVESGTLIFSTNGGQQWQALQSDTLSDRVLRIEFSDQAHGWATRYSPHNEQLLYRTTDGGQRWEQITAPNPCDEQRGNEQYSFVTPQLGWMLCSYGGAGGSTPKAVFKTEDGAQTWVLLTETTREQHPANGLEIASGSLAFFFINEQEGWFSGQRETVKTTDGGLSWQPIALDSAPNTTFRWVRFVSRQHGYAVVSGSYFTLLETIDGGARWTPIYHTAIWPSGTFHFTGRSTGIAVGTPMDARAVLRTIDGGMSWQPIGNLGSPTTKIVQLSFADASNGWAYSYDWASHQQTPDCALLRTADGGATWRQLPRPASADFACAEFGVSLNFVSPQIGFLAYPRAGGSHLLVTHDGGETFQQVASPPFALRQLDFVDANIGWAISGEAVGIDMVVATDDGGHTWQALPRNYQIPWTASVYRGTQNGVPIDPILPNYGASTPNLFPGGTAWLVVSVVDPMQGKNLLLRTSDGGRSWIRYQLEGHHFGAPQFVDPDHGWLLADGHLYRTTDGGRTWAQLR